MAIIRYRLHGVLIFVHFIYIVIRFLLCKNTCVLLLKLLNGEEPTELRRAKTSVFYYIFYNSNVKKLRYNKY